MNDFRQKLENYAELGIKIGSNLQKNQYLFLNISVENVPLARALTKKAYEVGAKNVFVSYYDDALTRMRYDYAPEDSFDFFPEWQAAEKEWLADHGAAFITVKSQSPDLLKGVNPDYVARANKAMGQALSKYREYSQANKISWTVMAAPTDAWAAKVFPDLPEDEQVNALWDAMFKATRADLQDPVAAWKQHDATLSEKVAFLNDKHYKALHYTAPGTDLTIELPKTHVWSGGGAVNEKGFDFMANIPTEEVFTAPQWDGVNGYVTSKKPLNYSGNLIDNFTVTFENGRIVDVKAEEGEDILKNLVATDEGSHYLGEVALVPHDSPISNSGILFYNTLFDENASNHIAIGSAYAFCIEGGTTMSQEELKANGLNRSLVHVDFMIGCADMDIDGVLEDGTTEPVFRKGNWAF